MQKWIMFTLFMAACLLSVILLANGITPPSEEDEAAAQGDDVLYITAKSYEFNEKEYKVKAGSKMTVKFKNKLGIHGMEIKDLDIELDNDHPEKEYTFDKPGTYEIHCSIMCGTGHADMKSVLIVE